VFDKIHFYAYTGILEFHPISLDVPQAWEKMIAVDDQSLDVFINAVFLDVFILNFVFMCVN